VLIAARTVLYDTYLVFEGEQIDLFPWILGGLLIAVAVPGVVALRSTADTPRMAQAVLHPVHTAQPAVEPISPPVAIEPASPPLTITPSQPVPSGQIWQCVVNGQKTFSDSPCGADAAVHHLSEVNVMDPAPFRRTPAYPTYYPPYPVDSPSSAYSFDPADSDAPDNYGSSATSPYIVINERGRREHRPQTHPHEHRPGSHRP